jgi:hypothetical protein
MPQSDARAWWADVQHVREAIERRRAEAEWPDAVVDRQSAARFVRTADERRGDELPGPASDRRFERAGHANHVPVDPDRARARGRRSEVREHWTGVERRDPNRADRRAAGRTDHHELNRAERRDPTRADRRGRGPADHHASARPERRDPVRAERRDSARPERRDSVGAELRESARPERRDSARAGRRELGRPERRASGRAERPDAMPHERPDAAAASRHAGQPTAAPLAAAPAPLSVPRPRRTVQITGRPVAAPRLVEVERRRPVRRPVERIGGRPDRIALWAVLLCFFLILVAASS